VATHEVSTHPFAAQERTPEQILLDPTDIVHEVAMVAQECRRAILTAFPSEDELIAWLSSGGSR
jgi:hypothetical protein